ncbi:hypothetical protein G6O67_003399 [Ophiocordyceps sinensis]|uniref:Proteinase inhibitor I1, Kazal n=2 Tax=Ophiocordyceps sinensis TaxID=72228 RepID=A0A8H4PWP7_9HYPO|nr:hypothetical protein OCS_04173 [Ophiocordyceps sinensis CO18]KAF4511618.1 hypothetical protein G6O67_003399 [Ophiocordyceps sinensis]
MLFSLLAALALTSPRALALAGPTDYKKPLYPACGGHTVKPLSCDEKSICVDDPRNPRSCGMACDVPGICIPKSVQTCEHPGQACFKGLRCYKDPRAECGSRYGRYGSSGHGKDKCKGICLSAKQDS